MKLLSNSSRRNIDQAPLWLHEICINIIPVTVRPISATLSGSWIRNFSQARIEDCRKGEIWVKMEVDGRIVKRQKLSNGVAKPQRQSKAGTSRIFAPYRTVGLVSPTEVPFTSIPLGKTTFQITTSVGRSLQTYDLRRGLNLVFITRPQTPEKITATKAWKDKIFAAWGGDDANSERGVWVFKRGKKEAELEVPADCKENVKAFCVFGCWVIGVCDTELLVWKTTDLELYTSLRGISPIAFTKCISSLPTFLNKIIVGREDGSAEIWNMFSVSW